MARTACLVCFISTVNGRSKKSLGRLALVAGTQQTLSNLFLSFDICGVIANVFTVFHGKLSTCNYSFKAKNIL
jgi:hypothetical protein